MYFISGRSVPSRRPSPERGLQTQLSICSTSHPTRTVLSRRRTAAGTRHVARARPRRLRVLGADGPVAQQHRADPDVRATVPGWRSSTRATTSARVSRPGHDLEDVLGDPGRRAGARPVARGDRVSHSGARPSGCSCGISLLIPPIPDEEPRHGHPAAAHRRAAAVGRGAARARAAVAHGEDPARRGQCPARGARLRPRARRRPPGPRARPRPVPADPHHRHRRAGAAHRHRGRPRRRRPRLGHGRRRAPHLRPGRARGPDPPRHRPRAAPPRPTTRPPT